MFRKPIGIVSCFAMLVAQMPHGLAQSSVASSTRPAGPIQRDAGVSPAIVDGFKANPKGGDELSKHIQELIIADPKLAPDVARYVQTTPGLTNEQKQAAVRGLAGAMNHSGVQAADLPMRVHPAPVEEVVAAPAAFPWIGVLAAAAVVAGGLCLALCDDDDERRRPVSP